MIGCIVTSGEISNLTDCLYMEKVYNILTRAYGINICYNSTTKTIECCTGFTNRTGVCEKDIETPHGNVECKVNDTFTENICAEKCAYNKTSVKRTKSSVALIITKILNLGLAYPASVHLDTTAL